MRGEARTLGESDKRFTWWEKESLTGQYPYIFINPVIMGDKMHETEDATRKLLRTKKGEQFVLSDSGGFQMGSRPTGEVVDTAEENDWGEAKIHPETLAEWETLNADAGIILDVAPYDVTSKEGRPEKEQEAIQKNAWGEEVEVETEDETDDPTFDEWKEKYFYPNMEITAENARRMCNRWEEIDTSDFQRVGVLQGQPAIENDRHQYELLEEWHEAQERVGEYDAFAIKPRPVTSIGNMVFFLSYAADRLQDYDYIHVLQLGNLQGKILAAYYAKLTGQWVTSDAGSWASATLWRQVELPNARKFDSHELSWPSINSRTVTISPRSDEEREEADKDAVRFDMYPCRCIVCQTARDEHGVEWITEEDSDSYNNAALCLHNLQSILQTEKVLQSLMRAHFDTLIDDLTPRDNENVKYFGNDFWHLLSTALSEKKLLSIYNGMQHIRTAYEEGIEVADRKATFDWYINSGSWSGYDNTAANSVI